MKNAAIRYFGIVLGLAISTVASCGAQELAQPSSVAGQLSKVAFASSQNPTKGFDIFEINAHGSGLRRIIHDQRPYWSWNCCPAWSPDGKQLAFVSSNTRYFGGSHTGVFIKESAGGEVKLVFRDDKMCIQDPAWSPDGQHLVFTRGVRSREFRGRLFQYRAELCAGQQVFSLKVDGSELRQLTHDQTHSAVRPAWSPDGSTIAYMSQPNSAGEWKAEICLINADGSNPRELTHGGGAREVNGDPTWSPDGKQIAFYSNRGGSYELYIMNINGANARQITKEFPGGVRRPSWSPEGSQIVLGTGDARAIFIINADGTGVRMLASAAWHPNFGKVPTP